jgi:hypothetical protein
VSEALHQLADRKGRPGRLWEVAETGEHLPLEGTQGSQPVVPGGGSHHRGGSLLVARPAQHHGGGQKGEHDVGAVAGSV